MPFLPRLCVRLQECCRVSATTFDALHVAVVDPGSSSQSVALSDLPRRSRCCAARATPSPCRMPTPQPALQQRPARQQHAARSATTCCLCSHISKLNPCRDRVLRPPSYVLHCLAVRTDVANAYRFMFAMAPAGPSAAAASSGGTATCASAGAAPGPEQRGPLVALPQVPHHQCSGAARVLPVRHQCSCWTASRARQSLAGSQWSGRALYYCWPASVSSAMPPSQVTHVCMILHATLQPCLLHVMCLCVYREVRVCVFTSRTQWQGAGQGTW
jgi:hypothetical protein